MQFSDLNGENRERGRMLGQKYQQSPDDLTIIFASGEGGKNDPFSSVEVSEQTHLVMFPEYILHFAWEVPFLFRFHNDLFYASTDANC